MSAGMSGSGTSATRDGISRIPQAKPTIPKRKETFARQARGLAAPVGAELGAFVGGEVGEGGVAFGVGHCFIGGWYLGGEMG